MKKVYRYKKLSIDKPFNYVFRDYKEEYKDNTIYFKGKLLKIIEEESNEDIKRYLCGGGQVSRVELERNGLFVCGAIYYDKPSISE